MNGTVKLIEDCDGLITRIDSGILPVSTRGMMRKFVESVKHVVEELRAENERLKADIALTHRMEIVKLEQENAALREFVRRFVFTARQGLSLEPMTHDAEELLKAALES